MRLTGMGEYAIRDWVLSNLPNADMHEAVMFLLRGGRFAGIDRSTVDREQVFPVPEPPEKFQTHA